MRLAEPDRPGPPDTPTQRRGWQHTGISLPEPDGPNLRLTRSKRQARPKQYSGSKPCWSSIQAARQSDRSKGGEAAKNPADVLNWGVVKGLSGLCLQLRKARRRCEPLPHWCYRNLGHIEQGETNHQASYWSSGPVRPYAILTSSQPNRVKRAGCRPRTSCPCPIPPVECGRKGDSSDLQAAKC